MSDELSRRREALIENQNSRAGIRGVVEGGGGGPYDPDMGARVSAIETSLRELVSGFARLEAASTRVEETVMRLDDRNRKMESDTLPKLAIDLAEVKGRISQLPTSTAIFAYMGGLVTLSLAVGGVAFVILRAATAP